LLDRFSLLDVLALATSPLPAMLPDDDARTEGDGTSPAGREDPGTLVASPPPPPGPAPGAPGARGGRAAAMNTIYIYIYFFSLSFLRARVAI
jgi:hypothetical protein